MEYRITKQELGNEWMYHALFALEKCMAIHGLPLYVVGARARDIAMRMMKLDEPKRHTEDLDVAVAIESWEVFDSLCSTMEKNCFKRFKNTQKFFYKGENRDLDFEVDVVPFGGVAVEEKIGWPPNGDPLMSVKCFQDVMKMADTVVVDEKFKFKMASLCGQFLIKLDAWNDRKTRTDKDAEDMLFILRNYFDTQILQEITPPDVVDFKDDKLDIIMWSAQWLAYDVGKLLTTEHLLFYSNLVAEELAKEENSELIFHFMKYYDDTEDDVLGSYHKCRDVWKVFNEILEKELDLREQKE